MSSPKHRNRNKLWPKGKRRTFLGGRQSVGIIELIVEMVLEDGNVPALDCFLEIRANGLRPSIDYVKNMRSLIGSTILELQRQGAMKKKYIPDKDGTQT